MTRPRFYALRGHEVVPCDHEEWRAMFEGPTEARRVALDMAPRGLRVSTVFLGICHNDYDQGPPIVFETMILGEPPRGGVGEGFYQVRSATWEEAETEHRRALVVEKHIRRLVNRLRYRGGRKARSAARRFERLMGYAFEGSR